MNSLFYTLLIFLSFFAVNGLQELSAQNHNIETVQIHVDEVHQTITGFGASLAYYENWLTAHPNRAEIYDVIFGELSLDILRVRNTHGYDEGMVGRVKQFADGAEIALGHPVDILVTSWGPPAYLKSNNDKSNGGTLKYTVADGKVNFDYAGFAQWWKESLDEYHLNGIYPTYISIQNEPDFKATWESCLLSPAEVVTAKDTIAGYNMALDAVYDTVMKTASPPLFLGPESIGIGYNAVENYINALDLQKLYGIAHHLYHGAEGGTTPNDPFTSDNYRKVGDFHPGIPHFQTEYSRGEWFTLAGMMYQSLVQENVTAFFYWDLIWDGAGLVNLHFPWNRNQWTNPKGYNRTRDFYVFKHFSGFIHPGWKRTGTSSESAILKTAAFMSASHDSATFIAINRSATDTFRIRLSIPGYRIDEATAYSTTEDSMFVSASYWTDSLVLIPPKSINTVDMRLSVATPAAGITSGQEGFRATVYPNPFSKSASMRLEIIEGSAIHLEVFSITGTRISVRDLGFLPAGTQFIGLNRNGLKAGTYLYRILSDSGKTAQGKFVVLD